MSTEPQNQPKVNPLSKFFRTPAIYITLPSGGKYWEEDAIDVPETGEFPVYPMTNKDEILLRTPDALLNGQGVIDVIQSCMPNIKNAWKMPSVDVDACLIAMRIASYGHNMDFDNTCPHCKSEHTYTMDLRSMMNSIKCPDYDQQFEHDGIYIRFRPQNYFDINRGSRISFELQKMQQAIDNISAEIDPNDEIKISAVSGQLNKLTELNLMSIANSTDVIVDSESGAEISDRDFINEFYAKIGGQLFNEIQEKLAEINSVASIKPVPVNCQTCNEEIQLTILFDYASFFVVGS